MKNLKYVIIIGIALVVAIAVVTAGKMGETSQAMARGSVLIAPELAEKISGRPTLYIIISNPDSPRPLGALRKSVEGASADGVVYDFVLTRETVQTMTDPSEWPGEFNLKARLDVDGAAGPDQPGDLVGVIEKVAMGSRDVQIRIDREIQ